MNAISEIEALREGRFEIDCPQIVLAQNKATNPRLYKGPGAVYQDKKGNLIFKVYAASVENVNMFSDMQDMFTAQSGKLYGAEECFTLEATDYRGAKWTSERILPKPSWAGQQVLIAGSIDTLSLSGLLTADRIASPNYIRMHFFDPAAGVPCTQFKDLGERAVGDGRQNFASFSALNCEFEIKRFKEEFVVQATSDQSLPPFFDSRVFETLQFVLARPLACRVLVVRKDAGVSSTEFSSQRSLSATHLEPPIGGNRIEAAAYAWRLFARYLEYVTREATSHYWHPCSAQLHNACEASANSLDAWALGLCVAVEGISNLMSTEALTDAEKGEVKKLERLLQIWTKCRKWSPVLRNRSLGLLSQLSNARVQDRLGPLVAVGKVDPTYLKAWSTLRHQRAHGRHRDPNKLSPNELQSIWSLMNRVTVLMYQVTFHLIEYEGQYTDYGQFNFPMKAYPLAVEGTVGGGG